MANTCNTNPTNTVPITNSSYSNYAISNNYGSISPIMTITDGSDTLTVKGSLVVNGRNLEERLDTIEKVLMIPERDVKLEKKYPKLKKMYDDYIKELSKARMWESLKGEKNV